MAARGAGMLQNKPPKRKRSVEQEALPLDAPHAPNPEANPDKEVMGRRFRTWLLEKYKYKGMTADDVCTAAYLSSGAGAVGVADLGVDPLAKGGNAARKITRALGWNPDRLYWSKIPMWDKKSHKRVFLDFPMHPVHESFSSHCQRAPDDFRFEALPEGQNLADVYYGHPVTLAHGDKSFPIGFFSDALPHTKKDSVYCYYWSNIVTGKRHIICVLRKKDLCQCSCRGQCTFGAVQRLLVWTFNAVANGTWPEHRHNGEEFSDWRAREKGDLAEGLRGALCQVRADLLEFVTSLGFKNWANVSRPCFVCDVTKDKMFDFPDSHDDCTWATVDGATYDRAVQASVKRIRVNEAQLKALVENLKFDHRRNGYAGLVLLDDLPIVGLKAGHRLVEEGPVFDLHALGSLKAPCLLTFFNCEGNVGLNFVCNLFSILGFSMEILALDVMHIMDLGVLQWLLGLIIRALINANFAKSLEPAKSGRDVDNVIQMRKEMDTFYAAAGPKERKKQSRLYNLTRAMLGTEKKPRLLAKAAETRHLLKFGQQLVHEHMALLGDVGVSLAVATDNLVGFYNVMQREPMKMSPLGVQLLQAHMSEFLKAWKAAGGHMYYKHHMAWHMAQQCDRTGNPRFSHTYPDETENRYMGTVAKSCHGGHSFYKSFLLKVCPDAA